MALFIPNWRTRLQPIRTASEIQVKIIIQSLQRTPLYQKLAKKVEELSLLGLSLRAIAKSLKVSKKTIKTALNYRVN
jgi:DNA-binding NarL/FixJ family response regulator